MTANIQIPKEVGSAKAATFPSPVCAPIPQDKEANARSTSILALTAPDANLIESKSSTSPVERAAMWLSEQSVKPAPLVPYLKSNFDLTPSQACEAISLARRFEINRRAFG